MTGSMWGTCPQATIFGLANFVKTDEHSGVCASELPWFVDGLTLGFADSRDQSIHASRECSVLHVQGLEFSEHIPTFPIVTPFWPLQTNDATILLRGPHDFHGRNPNTAEFPDSLCKQLSSGLPFVFVYMLPRTPTSTRYTEPE